MIKIIPIAILAILLSGCVSSPSSPVVGMMLTNTTHSGFGSGGIIDSNIKANKFGKSTCVSIMSSFAFGDCSINAAKKNGDITKVNSIEYISTNLFYFFSSYTTIVKGE
jgi:hypothetical protein